jgi:leucyl-tRNA synthetase
MLTQLKQLGAMYDWDKLVNTSKPDYYKWTQWLFLEMYKAGVAYRQKGLQNWCPKDQTVLANEQTISESGEKGVCVRCGTKVEKKELEQWFWKITDYADRLLSDLDKVEWPDKVKTMQENWIGRSEGAEINFKLRGVTGQDDDKHQVTVFTTRPDTLGGATFLVISPELAQKWLGIGWKASDEVKKYIDEAFAKADVDRLETSREKTGVDTGMKAMNPLTKEEIPVWVADYVLGGYGTGAIMAVPAHDERDWEFAQKFDLPIKTVVVPAKKRFALILHGTSGNNQKAWIPWLKSELEERGYEVAAPDLPNSEYPDHDAWQEALKPYANISYSCTVHYRK